MSLSPELSCAVFPTAHNQFHPPEPPLGAPAPSLSLVPLWHLAANPAFKWRILTGRKGFLYNKAALSITFFLSDDLFQACNDRTGASWADLQVFFPSWLLQLFALSWGVEFVLL